MWVKQKRANKEINEKGFLPEISKYDDDLNGLHHLREITIAAIPNGILQHKYNPNFEDGIWLAGRNAPTFGEDFRVRISFQKLMEKASWRVQKLYYIHEKNECVGTWKL